MSPPEVPARARISSSRTRSIGSRSINVDGLRLDAVHAIHDESETHFLVELAARARAAVAPARHLHLVLENDNNAAWPIARDGLFDAQWNDDFHHTLHVILTGETAGLLQGLCRRSRRAARPLPGGGLRLPGRMVGPSRPRPGRAEHRAAAARLRQLPAEPRSDRQPRVRRAADRAGGAGGTRCRHCHPAAGAVAAAALHG